MAISKAVMKIGGSTIAHLTVKQFPEQNNYWGIEVKDPLGKPLLSHYNASIRRQVAFYQYDNNITDLQAHIKAEMTNFLTLFVSYENVKLHEGTAWTTA